MVQHFFMAEDIETQDLGNGMKRRVLAHSKSIMIVEVAFEEGTVGNLHHHPHEQGTYVIEGEFEFEVAGKKQVLRAGDSAYREPNVSHGALCLKKGKLIDVFTPGREDFLEKSE